MMPHMDQPYNKLQMLLESEDPATIEQALELVRSLGPEAYAAVLRDVRWDSGGRLSCSGGPLQYAALLELWLEAPADARPELPLQRLDLSSSSLSRLPALSTSLRQLFLSYNSLRELPELGHLADLEHLDVSFNQLQALPRSLGCLGKLRRLDLRNNQLVALPAEIGELRSLRVLDLSANPLQALPPELASLPELEMLYLDRTGLQSLPDELGSSGLQVLSLLGTSLREPLPVLQRLPRLASVRLPASTELALRIPLERAQPGAMVHFR
jgi:hypothetical protein